MTFHAFAMSMGLVSRSFIADGKIHRCGTEKHPRSKNGAYMYDGTRGWCMRWGATDVCWWNDPNAKPWSEAEKKAYIAKQRAAKCAIQERYSKTASLASKLLSECSLDTHPYLKTKGYVEATGLIAPDDMTMPHPNGYEIPIGGALLIPMRDCQTNHVTGFQAIRWNDKKEEFIKLFLPGMRAKGAIFRMGRGKEVALCEGYVTGLSILAAIDRLNLDLSVVCCFSAGNIIEVAKTAGNYVMADHDKSKTGEQSALSTELPWAMPETEGFDWNDVHTKQGLMSVCRAISDLRKSRNTKKSA